MAANVSLAPPVILQFLNNAGLPNVGGRLLTQVGGVNYPTYQDSAGATPLPNPIPLNSRGEISNTSGVSCPLYMDSGVTYTFTLYDLLGNQIWTDSVTAPASAAALSGTGVPGGAGLIGFDGTTLDQILFSRLNRVVDSIADLRALLHTTYTRAFVTGYYEAHDGGGGAYQYDPNDTSTADNGGTIIVASDGGRWKLDVILSASICQFGAQPGSTDCSSNIASALIACMFVDAPPGTFTVGASTINWAVNGHRFRGAGKYSTILKTSSPSVPILSITGNQYSLEDIGFSASVTPSSGEFVNSAALTGNQTNVLYENYLMGFQAMEIVGTMRDCDFKNPVSGTGIGVQVNGYAGGMVMDNLIFYAAGESTQPAAGVQVVSCGALLINDCNIIEQGVSLQLVPGTGQTVASVFAENTFFDSSNYGIAITPAGTGAVVRCKFNNCWTSSSPTADGVLIDAGSGNVSGIDFTNHYAFLNCQNGIVIGPSSNVKFNGGAACGNGTGGSGAGISVLANVNDWSVQNMTIGAGYGLPGNTDGIYIASGTSADFTISGNDLQGNTGTPLSNGATGTNQKIYKNIGLVTKAVGNAGINSGSTEVVVNHGLYQAPTYGQVQLTYTSSPSGAGVPWVNNMTSTQFTINVGTAPSENISIGFSADLEI